MDEEAVETTVYSLAEAAPAAPERRTGERHLSLLRVGAMQIGDRRELCLIKNISAVMRQTRFGPAGFLASLTIVSGAAVFACDAR